MSLAPAARLHSRHRRRARPEASPAPDGADDPAADALEGLMWQFLDELLQGLSPDGMSDPLAPDAGGDGNGEHDREHRPLDHSPRPDPSRAGPSHRRPGSSRRSAARRRAGRRACPPRGRARPRQDAAARDPGADPRWLLQSHPVHAGPDPVRHRRDPDLPALVGGIRRRTRADHRQRGPGRRDQPRPRACPVGAARGDGGATGHGRRSHLPDAEAVPGRGDPEPGRVGGRLPPCRGAARPVPDADPGRLPDPDRGTGHRRADGGRAAPGGATARPCRRRRSPARSPADRDR